MPNIKVPSSSKSRRAAALLLAVLMLAPDLAPIAGAVAASRSLHGIEVASGQVQIKTDGPVTYKSFIAQNPPRLVLDIFDTQYRAGGKAIEGDGGNLQRVRGGQFQSKPRQVSRVVLELASMAGYEVVNLPNGIKVLLGQTAAAAAKQAMEPQAAEARPVELYRDVPAPEAKVEGGEAKAEAAVPADGDAEGSDENAAPGEPAKPGAKKASSGRGRRDIMATLPKERVDLDYDAADIRDIIRLLGIRAGVNIIYGSDVNATLTIHLSQVPFDEAFRTVLAMGGLTTLQSGENILRIMTPQALKTERGVSMPTTRVFTLSYTKADDIKPQIDAVRGAEGRGGSSAVAKATNQLIVTDTPDGLLQVETLIAQLDRRPRQVLIEAKLLEVSLTKAFNLGIQWDYKSAQAAGSDRWFTGTSANPLATPTGGSNATAGVGGTGRGSGVFAPATNVVGALTLGKVTDSSFLTATLTAAATNGKLRVLSDPKVATLNNQEATINITSQIPYATTNVTGTAATVTQTVSNITTGIILTVTPTINADGRVTLKIKPQVSQPGQQVGSLPPTVDTRSADTTILVKDGETIVIGGLITDSDRVTVTKVPFFGDIPIIGALFRSTSTARDRRELMVFVKPTILPN